MRSRPACGATCEVHIDGRKKVYEVPCTLPVDHEDWHEHADERLRVVFVWHESRLPRPGRNYETGPYQTHVLGRCAPA